MESARRQRDAGARRALRRCGAGVIAPSRGLRAVAFDLDGTLYLGSEVVPGAPEIVAHVRGTGLDVLFLANSNTANPRRLQERLASLGIAAATEEIYSSATAAARYVAERGHAAAYVVGSPGIRDEVAAHGLRVTARADDAQALVVGFVPGFDPAALPDGFRPDCEFVAANLDVDYPVEGGARMPGSGQTVGRVAARLGRGYDFCAGKPGTYILECVERDLGLSAAEIVVVGDNVASDVAMARAAGCRSILIAPPGTGAGGASAAVASLAELPAALDVKAGQ
jgi:HAD superfamily hydrolase (TIGR01450 family)